MILYDLLKLQTETSDDIEYVIYSNDGMGKGSIDFIPYKDLIKEIAMWEIESGNKVKMKIWLN